MTRLLPALLLLTLVGVAGGSELKLLLRYDDFSRSSNYAAEAALFAAAEEAGGGVLVGVIPFQGRNCWRLMQRNSSLPSQIDARKRALLREYYAKGVVAIAVHGCSHQSVWDQGVKSEFAGVKPAYQKQLLSFAKKSLEAHLGLPVRSFVPPWNT